MIEVTLSWPDMFKGAWNGCRRAIASMKRKHQDRNGAARENLWDLNIRGALGELAFARAMKIPYEFRIDVFKGPDFGKTGQIKTLLRHDYDLAIRPDARDGDRYVLVTGEGPTFRIHGWYPASEAKSHPEWMRDPNNRGPEYFVSQRVLLPLVRSEVVQW